MILNPADLTRFINYIRARFDLLTEVDIAVENDPREFNQEPAKTMARVGVNRASLGLRDVNLQVQQPMCFLEVDLGAIAGKFDANPRVFAGALAALEEMATDGLVEIDGRRVRMTEAGRPFLGTACATFDSCLETATGRHAQAV